MTESRAQPPDAKRQKCDKMARLTCSTDDVCGSEVQSNTSVLVRPGPEGKPSGIESLGTQELPLQSANGSDESSRRSTSEERLQEALIVVGNRLLANVAEENPEAAFRVWLHKHPRSYSNDSEEYKEKLELFTKNAAEVRELNATYNADNNDKDLCELIEYEYADEIDLTDCAPGGITGCGDFVEDDMEIATELPESA